MIKTPTFVVNDNQDPKKSRKAIQNLKRMIKYGKIAEAALKNINTQGYHSGRSPIINEVHGLSISGFSNERNRPTSKLATCEYVRFHKRVEVSRSDVGDLSKLRAEVDHTDGGKPVLYLAGPLFFQLFPNKDIFEIKEGRRQLGFININKGYISLTPHTDVEPPNGFDDKVIRIYQAMAFAKESLQSFSAYAGTALADVELVKYATPYPNKKTRPGMMSKTIEIQNKSGEWIYEEGHAERLFLEINRLVKVHQVMTS